MKKITVSFLVFFITTLNINAQCVEENEHKVLLVGDSWAFFMSSDGTFNDVFDRWGHSNFTYFSNATLAVSGARAEDFLIDSRLDEIEEQLTANPGIKVVHLSLGGNDILGNWNVDFTEEETDELFEETYDEVNTIIEFIKNIRPDVHIVYSGYMYANFEEVIADVAPFETSHPFYGNWEEMGFPNFEQINTLLSEFSTGIYELSLDDDRVDFMNVPALMQYIYGQEEPLGVDPGGTYPPFFQPLPAGDLTYPSPKLSMRDYGLARDCFHLSAEGYVHMIDYQTRKFYHKFLMDDIYLLAEGENKTGALSSVGDIYSLPSFGEGGIAAHLSFNTELMADTLVESASIFLRRDSLIEENIISELVTVKIINGNFGETADIEAVDYTVDGDATGSACVFGATEVDGDWIRIDLPEELLPFITNGDRTQFLIEIEDAVGGRIYYAGTEDLEYAPVLNIKYKSTFAGIKEEVGDIDIIVFPNPASKTVQIFSKDQIDQIELFNTQGELMMTQVTNSEYLDIESFPAGSYFIRITTGTRVTVKQIVKK